MQVKPTAQEVMYPASITSQPKPKRKAVRCLISEQTHAEEWVNVLTHGAGLLWAMIGTAVLLLAALKLDSLNHLIACSIYGASMIMLFGASTLYHAAMVKSQKEWLRVSDHICIYFLIAGTYTPFGLLALQEGAGYTLVWALWGMAFVGTVSKIVAKFRGWKKRSVISTGYYLLMGWMGLLVMGPMKQALPTLGYDLLVWGGMSYSVGTIFYMWRGLPFGHGIWHLFVLGGAGCHFFAVYVSIFA